MEDIKEQVKYQIFKQSKAMQLVNTVYQKSAFYHKYQYYLEKKQIPENLLPFILRVIQQKQLEMDSQQLRICLCNRNIKIKDCHHFIKANMSLLTYLDLNGNQVGDEGCKALIKAFWPELKLLSLTWNKISQKGCSYLILTEWKQLQQLDLQKNPIGKKGFFYLRNKFPGCKISAQRWCKAEFD